LNRFAAACSGKVVCVSSDAASVVVDIEGVPPEKVGVIANGIDIGRFEVFSRGKEAEGNIVCVARLSPEKNHACLLRAFALVLREHAARLILAGSGPLQEDLKSMAHELGIDQKVEFLGDRRDVPQVLANASLFALASRTEGVSLTLLEAMAARLPVVCTRVGGNPEVVAEGETGFLVASDDHGALAGRLLELLCNGVLRRDMGDRGHERVLQRYDVRKTVAAYEALYCSLCGRTGCA